MTGPRPPRPERFRLVVAVLVVLAVLPAACAGPSPDDSASPPSPTATASSPESSNSSVSRNGTTGDGTEPDPSAADATDEESEGSGGREAASTSEGAPREPLESIRVGFAEVASIPQPLDLVAGPDSALYVASKTGLVFRLDPGDTPQQWLDMRDRVSTEGERGLLGIAFGPRGRFYASFTDLGGNTRVVAWRISGSEVDAGSETEVIAVDQPFANHNGGHIEFGPDGMLYLGLGDGGSGYDPLGNGQDTSSLLGSILRIDAATVPSGYRVPSDNPYVDHPEIVAPEIWLFGVRNPWRFSLDPPTGDLWIGDVGQDRFEEIDHLPGGTDGQVGGRGANLGWSILEGFDTIGDRADLVSDPVAPVFVYEHDRGVSVTGGRVYRGSDIPALDGVFLFADFGSGTLWAIRPAAGGHEVAVLAENVGSIAGFGTDATGEVYLLDLSGRVLKLTAAD